MYEAVQFHHVKLSHPLDSGSQEVKNNFHSDFDKVNKEFSQFHITGEVDLFLSTAVSEEMKQVFPYMQSFSLFQYGQGSFTRRSGMSSWLLLYTHSGEGKLHYNDKTYRIKEGDGFFINCHESHEYEALSEVWSVTTMHISGAMVSYFYDRYIVDGPVFHAEKTHVLFNRIERLLKIYQIPPVYRDGQAGILLQTILMDLLLLHEASHDDAPDTIRQALIYIHDHYTESFTLDELAEHVHLNKYYLIREIRRYVGFTPKEYVTRLRMQMAADLLLNSSLPAVKIAHEVGIHDVNNFNRIFKKHFNKTPAVYRKNFTSSL